MAELDLASIEAAIAKMSPEELAAELTKVKVKQRVATKKYYNPETAKAQRVKRSAELAEMVKAAKAAGIYDSILEKAKIQADEQLANEQTEAEDEAA